MVTRCVSEDEPDMSSLTRRVSIRTASKLDTPDLKSGAKGNSRSAASVFARRHIHRLHVDGLRVREMLDPNIPIQTRVRWETATFPKARREGDVFVRI